MKKKIRVLVIDDSSLIRKILTQIINATDDLVCIGAAPDPLVAREMIRNLSPDVLTLDIEMPRMDGLAFLEKLMRLRPTPVVMVSSLTEAGADATLRALELGAVDFVPKPKLGIEQGLLEYADALTGKIRAAAMARLGVHRSAATAAGASAGAPGTATATAARALGAAAAAPRPAVARLPLASTEKLILIGASTGGTEAIREVLTALPPDAPGILITQHMPPGFTKSFAERLDKLCRISVKEAEHGERVLPGHAYIAPGGRHLKLVKNGANYQTALSDEPPVNHHRPSVEVLFRSAALVAGPSILGIMLTGMGKDGAVAMNEMREAGAYNLAQDEASCVVFGMPREAINAGGVHQVLPLGAIAPHLMTRLALDGVRAIRV